MHISGRRLGGCLSRTSSTTGAQGRFQQTLGPQPRGRWCTVRNGGQVQLSIPAVTTPPPSSQGHPNARAYDRGWRWPIPHLATQKCAPRPILATTQQITPRPGQVLGARRESAHGRGSERKQAAGRSARRGKGTTSRRSGAQHSKSTHPRSLRTQPNLTIRSSHTAPCNIRNTQGTQRPMAPRSH